MAVETRKHPHVAREHVQPTAVERLWRLAAGRIKVTARTRCLGLFVAMRRTAIWTSAAIAVSIIATATSTVAAAGFRQKHRHTPRPLVFHRRRNLARDVDRRKDERALAAINPFQGGGGSVLSLKRMKTPPDYILGSAAATRTAAPGKYWTRWK